MPGENLTSELRRRAEARAAEIHQDASERIAEIEEDSARQIEKRRAAALRDEEDALRKEARASIAAEKQHALRLVLRSRSHLVDRVIAKAIKLIPEFSATEGFRASMEVEVAKCLRFVGPKPATVRCSGLIAPAARAAVLGNDHIVVKEDDTIQAGFVIETRDGTMSIDHRTETRLRRSRALLATNVLRTVGES